MASARAVAARYVATSFRCDRETAELGEDYPAIAQIERAYRLLEQRLERALRLLHARRSIDTIMEFAQLLADARHDASFGTTLTLAHDAFAEARVVQIAESG